MPEKLFFDGANFWGGPDASGNTMIDGINFDFNISNGTPYQPVMLEMILSPENTKLTLEADGYSETTHNNNIYRFKFFPTHPERAEIDTRGESRASLTELDTVTFKGDNFEHDIKLKLHRDKTNIDRCFFEVLKD